MDWFKKNRTNLLLLVLILIIGFVFNLMSIPYLIISALLFTWYLAQVKCDNLEEENRRLNHELEQIKEKMRDAN